MPFITFTLQKGWTKENKKMLADAVHHALVVSGVPNADRFQRFITLEADDLIFDPLYPNLTTPRTQDFVIVEILLSVGRSVKIKRKILADLMSALKDTPISPNDVMVCFKETTWENWAFANGEQIHI